MIRERRYQQVQRTGSAFALSGRHRHLAISVLYIETVQFESFRRELARVKDEDRLGQWSTRRRGRSGNNKNSLVLSVLLPGFDHLDLHEIGSVQQERHVWLGRKRPVVLVGAERGPDCD